jgi:stringent starvation protein B
VSDSSGSESGSTRPYLVRGIHEWCLDNGLTPQIMVDVTLPEVNVPMDFVKDDRIVLNLHPNAVRALEIGNDYLLFSARFSGRSEEIIIPVEAVLAVYARENGQGIVFQADGSGITPPSPPGNRSKKNAEDETAGKSRQGSHLKVVK